MLSASKSCSSAGARHQQYSRSGAAAAPHRPIVARSLRRKVVTGNYDTFSSRASASSTGCELLESPAPIANHLAASYRVKPYAPAFVKENNNMKDYSNDARNTKHSQLFLVLALFAAATAIAEAGPVGWGGLVVLGSMVASWLVPGIPKAIFTVAVSQLTGAFKSRARPSIKSSIAPLPLVPAGTIFATKTGPVSHLLTFTASKKTTFKAEGSKASTQLPAGSGMRTAAVASHTVQQDSKVQQGENSTSSAVSQGSESARHSTPAAAVTAEVPVKAAPLQVQPAAAASCAPGGEAHAAEQVAVPVSSTMRPVLAAICLRLASEENRKQPGSFVFTNGDLAIAPGGYWCNPGNAARLSKTQGQVQNRFLPASAADDSGLPRVEVASMGDIFRQQWKALRVYATTPDNWPTEGKVVTYGDLNIVAAYGIQA